MKMKEERFFIWSDGDGHSYCVPCELKDKTDAIDNISFGELGYDNVTELYYKLFSEIESKVIPFEGYLTFTDPNTVANEF